MPGHRLSAALEHKGYSLEFWPGGEVTDPDQPCMTEVVVTYTGDDPGGVDHWEACYFLDLSTGGVSPDTEYPNAGRCVAGDFDRFTPASDDFSTPLQIIAETTTSITLRCMQRYPSNPATIDGGSSFTHAVSSPLLFVNAFTDSGDWETLSFLVGCPQVKPVEDYSRLSYADGVTCSSAFRWEVIDKDNAGPFVRGASPSSDGVMLTIKLTGCWNLTPPAIVGGTFPSPDFFERQWEVGDDCCPDDPADQAEFDSWTQDLWANFPSAADVVSSSNIIINAVRPPRVGDPWASGLRTPILRQRWPIISDSGIIDRVASAADATHGSLIIGYHAVYEVFLGTCSRYLTETDTVDWDIAGTNGATPRALQANAMLAYQAPEADPSPLFDVDVSTATTIATASPAGRTLARVTGSKAKLSVAGCCTCCGCDEEAATNTVVYKPTATTAWHTCNHEDASVSGSDTIAVDCEDQYEYRQYEIDYDLSHWVGTPIAFGPYTTDFVSGLPYVMGGYTDFKEYLATTLTGFKNAATRLNVDPVTVASEIAGAANVITANVDGYSFVAATNPDDPLNVTTTYPLHCQFLDLIDGGTGDLTWYLSVTEYNNPIPSTVDQYVRHDGNVVAAAEVIPAPTCGAGGADDIVATTFADGTDAFASCPGWVVGVTGSGTEFNVFEAGGPGAVDKTDTDCSTVITTYDSYEHGTGITFYRYEPGPFCFRQNLFHYVNCAEMDMTEVVFERCDSSTPFRRLFIPSTNIGSPPATIWLPTGAAIIEEGFGLFGGDPITTTTYDRVEGEDETVATMPLLTSCRYSSAAHVPNLIAVDEAADADPEGFADGSPYIVTYMQNY